MTAILTTKMWEYSIRFAMAAQPFPASTQTARSFYVGHHTTQRWLGGLLRTITESASSTSVKRWAAAPATMNSISTWTFSLMKLRLFQFPNGRESTIICLFSGDVKNRTILVWQSHGSASARSHEPWKVWVALAQRCLAFLQGSGEPSAALQ